ncbi:hypothetical protein JIR23_31330 [Bradyrhizobium diazoefficiens]|nr:hypothetical protein [Bradyrhizobium diazoefficiens]QQN63929.1 hypothetical protein JIR23_31330 [Bradyrhizobium diazoefficiens]
MKRPRSYTAVASLAIAPILLASSKARATDEIQVYNAGSADVGRFTIQQHLNCVALGQRHLPFSCPMSSPMLQRAAFSPD